MKPWDFISSTAAGDHTGDKTNAKLLFLASLSLQADPNTHSHRALLILQQGKDTTGPGDGAEPGAGRDSDTNLILAVLGLNQSCL